MRHRRPQTHARGFGLVTAIFVLVVLAGLGIALVSLQTTQSKAGALDVQATRAYFAARSGLEWPLWRSLRVPAAPLACANNTYSFKLPATTLNSFTVTVVCTSTTILLANGISTITTNTLTSTACNAPDGSGNCPSALAAPGPDYIERRIVASYQQ